MIDVPTIITPLTSQAEAQRSADEYVASYLDPSLRTGSGFLARHERPLWRFIIRSPHGPLGYILVDAATGAVVPLMDNEIRIIQEHALIAEAESRAELPVDAQGCVPSEYARRRANGYLNNYLSLYYSAADGIFIPLHPPIWQFTIRFRRPRCGAFILGTLDVDAQTGEPIPLTIDQIEHIMDRTNALIRHQTQATAG
jgi:hypothetical protein